MHCLFRLSVFLPLLWSSDVQRGFFWRLVQHIGIEAIWWVFPKTNFKRRTSFCFLQSYPKIKKNVDPSFFFFCLQLSCVLSSSFLMTSSSCSQSAPGTSVYITKYVDYSSEISFLWWERIICFLANSFIGDMSLLRWGSDGCKMSTAVSSSWLALSFIRSVPPP